MKKKKTPYWEKRSVSSGNHRGTMSHQVMTHQRGLKGSKLGPANDGRKLTDEERRAVIEQMKKDGKL